MLFAKPGNLSDIGGQDKLVFFVLISIQITELKLEGGSPFLVCTKPGLCRPLNFFTQAPKAFWRHHFCDGFSNSIKKALSHFFGWLCLREWLAKFCLNTLEGQHKLFLGKQVQNHSTLPQFILKSIDHIPDLFFGALAQTRLTPK